MNFGLLRKRRKRKNANKLFSSKVKAIKERVLQNHVADNYLLFCCSTLFFYYLRAMFVMKNLPPARRQTNPILKQKSTKATIRVQLDARTRVTLPDMEAFKLWEVRYPNAKVIV